MPRTMHDNGEAFRAKIVTRKTYDDPDKEDYVRTSFEGPYAIPGAARSRITHAEKHAERENGWNRAYRPEHRGTVTITGTVERAVTNWEPVE